MKVIEATLLLLLVAVMVRDSVAETADTDSNWPARGWLDRLRGLELRNRNAGGGASATSSATSVGTSEDSRADASASAKATGGGRADAEARAKATEEGDAEAKADAVASGREEAKAGAEAEAGGMNCKDVANRASVIVSSSGGQATGQAYSYAKAVSYAKNAIAVAVSKAVHDARDRGGRWAQSDVESTSIAIAKIYVEAYAQAGVVVRVAGEGKASGDAQACAEAMDTVVAEAVAAGFAQALTHDKQARAFALAHALVAALAGARATAEARASTTGGSAQAYQSSMAAVVANAVAEAVAQGYALIWGGEATALSDSNSYTQVLGANDAQTGGGATTQGVGSADASGSANADFNRVAAVKCTEWNVLRKCCTHSLMKKAEEADDDDPVECDCVRPFRRGQDIECRYHSLKANGGTVLWVDRFASGAASGACYCPS